MDTPPIVPPRECEAAAATALNARDTTLAFVSRARRPTSGA
jgi:hypothetical protein